MATDPVWTDERIDEKMKSIDANMFGIRQEISGLREEMRGMRSDFVHFQTTMVRITFGAAIALLATLLTAILALA